MSFNSSSRLVFLWIPAGSMPAPPTANLEQRSQAQDGEGRRFGDGRNVEREVIDKWRQERPRDHADRGDLREGNRDRSAGPEQDLRRRRQLDRPGRPCVGRGLVNLDAKGGPIGAVGDRKVALVCEAVQHRVRGSAIVAGRDGNGVALIDRRISIPRRQRIEKAEDHDRGVIGRGSAKHGGGEGVDETAGERDGQRDVSGGPEVAETKGPRDLGAIGGETVAGRRPMTAGRGGGGTAVKGAGTIEIVLKDDDRARLRDADGQSKK